MRTRAAISSSSSCEETDQPVLVDFTSGCYRSTRVTNRVTSSGRSAYMVRTMSESATKQDLAIVIDEALGKLVLSNQLACDLITQLCLEVSIALGRLG